MWQPAGTGARSEFTALFENERVRSARRVALLRLLMTWAFLALSVLAVVAGYASTAARIVPLGIYALLALALYAAVRRSASLARHSWYALAFVDLPMIFTMQYQATLANFERTPVIATFTFSVFLFVLIASQLSLRRRNILATAAVAALFEVALLARAEIVYVILDVLVVVFGSALAASYLARRNVDLLQSALTQRRLTDRLARYFAPAV